MNTGLLEEPSVDTLKKNVTEELTALKVIEENYKHYKRLNAADASIFSTLISFGLATLFYILNPWAALAVGLSSFIGNFGASLWLGKRKVRYFYEVLCQRRKALESYKQALENYSTTMAASSLPSDRRAPAFPTLPALPKLELAPTKAYQRKNLVKSSVYFGSPLLIGSIALAFPPMPVDVWILNTHLFIGTFALFVPFLIPAIALLLGYIGYKLNKKKSQYKTRLQELAEPNEEDWLRKPFPSESEKRANTLKDNIIALNRLLEKNRTRRSIAISASSGFISGLAAAAFVLSLPFLNTTRVSHSTALTGRSLFDILGITISVPPVALALAACSLIAISIFYFRQAYKKWKAGKSKLENLESARNSPQIAPEKQLSSDLQKKPSAPSSGNEKAVGLTMATLSIVTSAICSLGVSLILTGISLLCYFIISSLKKKEGHQKTEKQEKLQLLQALKTSPEAHRQENSSPVPKKLSRSSTPIQPPVPCLRGSTSTQSLLGHTPSSSQTSIYSAARSTQSGRVFAHPDSSQGVPEALETALRHLPRCTSAPPPKNPLRRTRSSDELLLQQTLRRTPRTAPL